MIDYVGDLSRRDAELLAYLAATSHRILEFGVGASTQIFSAYVGEGGVVDSVDTDQSWIARTSHNLAKLGLRPVRFHDYKSFVPKIEYDLIFVDGIDELRAEFALTKWLSLKVGGSMCFHDTRRTKPHGASPTSDVQNVCRLIEIYSPEIGLVSLNADESNITIVSKRMPLFLENWNKVEGRTPAQIGLA